MENEYKKLFKGYHIENNDDPYSKYFLILLQD